MFVDRIGVVLVAPRQAVRQNAAAARDVAWLLAARVVAGETPRLARAVMRGVEGSPAAAASGILQAASAILPDLLGILIGAILLQLLGGRKKPDRSMDLAAQAWIPYLAVQLVGALLFTALGRPMRPFEEHAVDFLAVGWASAVWLLSLVELKRA